MDNDIPAVAAPLWMLELHEFRQRLFLRIVEPVIVAILGPGDENDDYTVQPFGKEETLGAVFGTLQSSNDGGHVDASHRRLGFLPNYVGDVSAFRETSMSFATLAMLFLIMSCIFVVFFSCFYHSQKTSPLFISPRRHRLPKLVPPPLPVDGPFSWVKVCFFMSDEEIINRIGYDSLIFLRFHRLALRCIFKMSVFSFIVLLPLNFTGGGHANASDLKGYVGSLLFTDFLRFTMANVSGGSPRLWVHCFAAYLLTAIVVRELLVEYETFNGIRHRYLLSREPHLRTVLVTNIPRHLRAPNKITTYFRHVYPEAVKSVTMCQNLIRLERIIARRKFVLSMIEHELLILCRAEKRRLVGQTRVQGLTMAFLTCRCLERLGIFDGAQERLSKLYTRLEALNDLTQMEMTRRKRVMQKLDTMEAGTGFKDIDYILASPFDASDPSQRRALGLDVGRGSPQSTYRPPSIGAPRNPDGSVDTTHPAQQGDAPLIDDQQYGRREANLAGPSDGPVQRTASPSLAEGTEAPASEFLDDAEMFDTFSVQGQNAAGDDDANAKKIRQPLKKAKHAIRRYSRLARDVSLFGRPVRQNSFSVGNASSQGFAQPPSPISVGGDLLDHTNEVTDKAFVVMRTFTAATIAIQSMHSSKPGSKNVTTAPEPRDILWGNVYLSKGSKRTRSYLGEALVLAIITFYVVPVALVSLLVSESALVSSSPRLAQLDQASAFFSSAIAMVQPLCIVGIQQLLPPLFVVIGQAEGLMSFSEVQMRAFSRYFLFQVLNVFLVTTIAGSVFDTIAVILENPEAMFEMLGNSLPRMSSFFITYVTMKAFLGLGVELVRTMSLVQAILRYILFPNATLRSQRGRLLGMRAIDDPGWFPFHKVLAQDMLVVVISVVFAVVAPLVLLPCTLFCLFSRILWTHHHLYVYESAFETGGQFWPKIFRRFIFGLMIAQATITGQFILKEARHEAYATIALMFMTYVFLRSTRARYDPASSTLPLEVATVMDISLGQEEEAMRNKQESLGKGGPSTWVPAAYDAGGNGSVPESSETGGDESQEGSRFVRVGGLYDPFEQAYLQPVLRADPRARPEQPFPPAQLGRAEVLMGQQVNDSKASTLGVIDEEETGSGATVRLKSLNQQDRKLIDRWWNDQLQRAGEQDLLSVLTGEDCGTLMIGKRANLVESDRFSRA